MNKAGVERNESPKAVVELLLLSLSFPDGNLIEWERLRELYISYFDCNQWLNCFDFIRAQFSSICLYYGAEFVNMIGWP